MAATLPYERAPTDTINRCIELWMDRTQKAAFKCPKQFIGRYLDAINALDGCEHPLDQVILEELKFIYRGLQEAMAGTSCSKSMQAY